MGIVFSQAYIELYLINKNYKEKKEKENKKKSKKVNHSEKKTKDEK